MDNMCEHDDALGIPWLICIWKLGQKDTMWFAKVTLTFLILGRLGNHSLCTPQSKLSQMTPCAVYGDPQAFQQFAYIKQKSTSKVSVPAASL